VWRQPALASAASRRRRFISTCVETASAPLVLISTSSVHLHVCGDSRTIRFR